MAKRVQHIGHATATALVFTGLEREITVDTSKKTIRVHDGLTKGGFELALASGSNIQQATALVDGIMTAVQVVQLDAATADILVNAGLIATQSTYINLLFTITNNTTVQQDINTAKLATIESGATADQTKADIDALGINAALIDSKNAADFAWRANNLSDLGSVVTARSNLGLGTGAVRNTYSGSIDGPTGNAIYALPVGISCVRTGTGQYQITHNFGTTNYVVNLTALAYTSPYILSKATNSFIVRIINPVSHAQVDSDFDFFIDKA